MNRFFNSRLFEGISKLADIMILSLYFWVCSIPIFTIGASATGLYYATHKCVFKGRGYTREFFHSFKDNFKQSTLSWLVFLLLFLVLATDIYITRHMASTSGIIAAAPIFFMVITVFALCWAIYHFAYIARFENGFKESFKVSAAFMIINLGWTLLMVLVLIAVAVMVYRFVFLVVFAPGIVACVLHPILEKVFRKYMSAEDLAKEDE